MRTLRDHMTLFRCKFGNLGYLGFLGFTGFLYYGDRNPAWFLLFSLFGLFGLLFLNRFLNRPIDELPDERYYANTAKARAAALAIPNAALALVAIVAVCSAVTKELILLICSFGFAATMIAYSFFFWLYERKGEV